MVSRPGTCRGCDWLRFSMTQQLLDEPAYAIPNACFDRVEPGLSREQPRAVRNRRAILCHGVVSAGANAGLARCNEPETTPPPDSTTLATAPRPPMAKLSPLPSSTA